MPIMSDFIDAYYQNVQEHRRTRRDGYSVNSPHETTARLHKVFQKRHSGLLSCYSTLPIQGIIVSIDFKYWKAIQLFDCMSDK